MTPPAPDHLFFEVPGPPQPWQRAAPIKKGKKGKRTQKATRSYESIVAGLTTEAMCRTGFAKLAKPTKVQLELEIRYPTNRKADIDNFVKAIMDGLTQGGIWDDDSQVRYIVGTLKKKEDGVTPATAGVIVIVRKWER